jgi:hypothetical protein
LLSFRADGLPTFPMFGDRERSLRIVGVTLSASRH